MLGFSYYLSQPINSATEDYFQSMADHGFQEVFTSLHIPEENPKNKKKLMQELMEAAEFSGLSVVVDVDQPALSYLPDNISSKLTVRLDDGFSPLDIAKIATQIPVALNASTITDDSFFALRDQKIELNQLEAWHNFYPRPETGLDTNWFISKNRWLKSLGFKTQAFIPGDTNLRGPIYEGLPTLESQRRQNRLASALELDDFGVDKVIIGDPQLSAAMQNSFQQYYLNQTVILHYEKLADSDFDTSLIYSNRLDPARDVIRLQESRHLNQATVSKINTVQRKIGSITMDNHDYGRYQGEVQIAKQDLPKDDRVNVIGKIVNYDLPLLNHVGAGQKIKLIKVKG